MRRGLPFLTLLLAGLAGCPHPPPPPPPPVLYQLTWDAYNVPVCPQPNAPCFSAFSLGGPGVSASLGPGVISYSLGALAAGTYTYTLTAEGMDANGSPASSPTATAVVTVPGVASVKFQPLGIRVR